MLRSVDASIHTDEQAKLCILCPESLTHAAQPVRQAVLWAFGRVLSGQGWQAVLPPVP